MPRDVFGDYQPPYEHVLLLFIDAFGWRFLEQALAGSTFLQRVESEGVISQLTAQFPSTTAVHVTTINTGQPPLQSGVYAWQYYDPVVGTTIEALPFSYFGGPREGLLQNGIDPAALFPGPSVYEQLATLGVRSFVFEPAEIANSPCNRIYMAGATLKPYRTLAQALAGIADVTRERGPTYSLLYYDRLDGLNHTFGPTSAEVAAEIEGLWLLIEGLLHQRMRPSGKTLLLITADHGHIGTSPGRTTFVNQVAPDIVPLLQKERTGRLKGPAGGRRDFFLHVQEEHRPGVVAVLRDVLADKAEVVLTEDLVRDGYFGPGNASERFLTRAGNVVVLPRPGEAVWWHEPGHVSKGSVSHHGGLTPEEMDIPLLVLER